MNGRKDVHICKKTTEEEVGGFLLSETVLAKNTDIERPSFWVIGNTTKKYGAGGREATEVKVLEAQAWLGWVLSNLHRPGFLCRNHLWHTEGAWEPVHIAPESAPDSQDAHTEAHRATESGWKWCFSGQGPAVTFLSYTAGSWLSWGSRVWTLGSQAVLEGCCKKRGWSSRALSLSSLPVRPPLSNRGWTTPCRLMPRHPASAT